MSVPQRREFSMHTMGMELFGFHPLTLFELLLVGTAACASVVIGVLLAFHFVRFSSLNMAVVSVGIYTAGTILLLALLVALVFA
ncbi:hypothetical protein EBR66_04070 [bacterium]|nr:hypothetical protein [bacterium]